MPVEIFQTGLTKEKLDFCLAGDDLHNLVNLADELSRVGQDDDLDLVDIWVDFHQTGNGERPRLSTAIEGLEAEVLGWIVDDRWNGAGLDDTGLEVGNLGQALLDFVRHAKTNPGGIFGLHVYHDIFDIELTHSLDQFVGLPCVSPIGFLFRVGHLLHILFCSCSG